jgi:hypothetical protein
MEGSTANTAKLLKSNGGASRDRTDDLIVANDALSQLSYSPIDSRIARLFYQRSQSVTNSSALGSLLKSLSHQGTRT